MNINEQLEKLSVDCSRGAPMGRRRITDNRAAVVFVQQIVFVDGDYDSGGAYWGGGSPLFCAMSEAGDFMEFTRADCEDTARARFLQEYPELQIQDSAASDKLPVFLDSYIRCALGCSTDEDDGEPLDANYTAEDISAETMAEFREDCLSFLQQAGAMVDNDISGAGHDFWLTRNGHGAGFWDGDWEHGDELTAIAQKFNEINLYIGDDGKIY